MQIKTSPRVIAGFIAVLALAACGENTQQRAATGALGGAAVAGPPGLVVGGVVGAAVQ